MIPINLFSNSINRFPINLFSNQSTFFPINPSFIQSNTLFSNQYTIEEAVKTADIVIGAVLIPGGKAPSLITKSMLSEMEKGTVLIDVAVDQGGCIETCSPTTHENPINVIDGVIHYGVANMPGTVPQTAIRALANATLPYVLRLANKGWVHATNESTPLKKGLNIVRGIIEHPEVKSWYEGLNDDTAKD